MPSWCPSVALGAQPPGTEPPTSIQCPVEAARQISFPPTKTGATICTSCTWVPPM